MLPAQPDGVPILYIIGLHMLTFMVCINYTNLFHPLIIILGYFCLMDETRTSSVSDLCTPDWLTNFLKETFPDLFEYEDNTPDYTDFIYPMKADGITRFFYGSQLMDILSYGSYHYIEGAESYLRSVDQLRKEYLPSSHYCSIRFLVSFFFFVKSLFGFRILFQKSLSLLVQNMRRFEMSHILLLPSVALRESFFHDKM